MMKFSEYELFELVSDVAGYAAKRFIRGCSKRDADKAMITKEVFHDLEDCGYDVEVRRGAVYLDTPLAGLVRVF
jgi:hypothetical protein